MRAIILDVVGREIKRRVHGLMAKVEKQADRAGKWRERKPFKERRVAEA